MPYVNVKVTREGVTRDQKRAIVKGITDVLVEVLNKSPATTFVVIDEVELEDWGIGGMLVEEYRAKSRPDKLMSTPATRSHRRVRSRVNAPGSG